MPTAWPPRSKPPGAGPETSTRISRLRFITFLAPSLRGFYEFLSRYLGVRLGFHVEFREGESYDELAADADVAFVCGLPYVQSAAVVEPVAAPVLRGGRYGGKPIYFSDVIVRRDSPYRTFADLRGRSWAYNEPRSQSGHGVVRYHLAHMGAHDGYFGHVVESGWHQRSLDLVRAGAVDAAAIDSHVLAIWRREQPRLAAGLRVLATLGPSTIQPVVAARRLPEHIKAGLRDGLSTLHHDALAWPYLTRALVKRFVPVADRDYDDIRHMAALAKNVSLAPVMGQPRLAPA